MALATWFGPLFLVVVWPLVALVHELGHAWAALRFTPGPVRVAVGRPRPAFERSFGRLTVVVSPIGSGGVCRTVSTRLPARRALILTLAGPAASFGLAGLLAAGAIAASGSLVGSGLAVAAWSSALGGGWSLIPGYGRRGAEAPTDGLVAWTLLRHGRTPALRPAPARSGRRWSQAGDPITGEEIIGGVIAVGLGALVVSDQVTWEQLLPWALALSLIGLGSWGEPRRPAAAPSSRQGEGGEAGR